MTNPRDINAPPFDLPTSVLAAMAKARAAGPLTPVELADLDNLRGRRVDQTPVEHQPEQIDTDSDEQLTLAHERKQALSLASEMTLMAASLRAVATGTASSLEITDLLGSIDGWGKLEVSGTLAWDVLLRHARPQPVTDARPVEVT